MDYIDILEQWDYHEWQRVSYQLLGGSGNGEETLCRVYECGDVEECEEDETWPTWEDIEQAGQQYAQYVLDNHGRDPLGEYAVRTKSNRRFHLRLAKDIFGVFIQAVREDFGKWHPLWDAHRELRDLVAPDVTFLQNRAYICVNQEIWIEHINELDQATKNGYMILSCPITRSVKSVRREILQRARNSLKIREKNQWHSPVIVKSCIPSMLTRCSSSHGHT